MDIFDSARWYDLGINWEARLSREIPVFREVFGPPGALGLLDAGCGPGRQIIGLTKAGYRVIGLDQSSDMLAVARENLETEGIEAELIESSFHDVPQSIGPLDGVYCIGNSLAASGSQELARRSIAAFASILRPEARLFVQILNFQKLRAEQPAVRGPRVREESGTEYVSTRVYNFTAGGVEVVNTTLWKENSWKLFAKSGFLYAISPAEIVAWCESAGLTVDALYGNYARSPFDASSSDDLIIVATRTRH